MERWWTLPCPRKGRSQNRKSDKGRNLTVTKFPNSSVAVNTIRYLLCSSKTNVCSKAPFVTGGEKVSPSLTTVRGLKGDRFLYRKSSLSLGLDCKSWRPSWRPYLFAAFVANERNVSLRVFEASGNLPTSFASLKTSESVKL